MRERIAKILGEVSRVIVGKDDVVETLLTALLADGHILLDDVPGVGKTTMAVALGRVLGLDYRRIQFTPDVLPSDITGFSMINRDTGATEFKPGVALAANILLADEINRTSSKTQSALLEAMEEGQVTVDGATYPLKDPFTVIATQNHVGTAGTQLLPYAQLDRFLVRVSVGYPDFASQVDILRDRQRSNPVDALEQVTDRDEVLAMRDAVRGVTVKDSVLEYITRLAMATRERESVELGVSPRGALAVCRMAKARAYVSGRDYATPQDVRDVFTVVCAHRIILTQKARLAGVTPERELAEALDSVSAPDAV